MSMTCRETDSDVSPHFPYVYDTDHDSLDETGHREVFNCVSLNSLCFMSLPGKFIDVPLDFSPIASLEMLVIVKINKLDAGWLTSTRLPPTPYSCPYLYSSLSPRAPL